MSDAGDEVARALAEVARLAAEAALPAGDDEPGTALMPATPGLPAEQVKAALVEARRQAAARASDLQASVDRARAAIENQRRACEAELAGLAAILDPLRKQAALAEEAIWTISLYLGIGEEIVQLADGEPAPAGEPIRIWQGVLAMDEESALDAEDGGIDHMGIGRFDEWITADWRRVEQLIPAARGVVAIMPRRSSKDYGDPWANQARNQENHATYLLVRNGRCLYRYIAEDFNAGPRLVPARDEFTAFFTTRRHNWQTRQDETVRLEPGTPEWDRAEQKASARQRHYMRLALILQGLVDRTAALHPLPVPGLSLLHPEAYEAGHVVLIADDEHALTTGRPSFRQWLTERNSKLRPGMRVVGSFAGEAWRNADESPDRRWGEHSRIWPRAASQPVTGRVYTIERRESRWLVFLYERTDKVWRRNVPVPGDPGYVYPVGQVTPTQRASCRITADDEFIIPFDLVTAEECQWYLQSRVDRHAYVAMFPVLKAVIKAKREEAAAEEPMRKLLAAAIVRDHDVSYQDAEEAVPGLVEWWKLANRHHRPLVTTGDPATEKKAIQAISREFAARRAAVTGGTASETKMTGQIRADTPGVMLIARRKDGRWVAFSALPRQHEREPQGVWLREHTWSKTLAGHRARDWIIPEPSRIARWRVLWTSPAWAERDQGATAATHLSDPEIAQITAGALAEAGRQAAAPYKPYAHCDPGEPLGGEPAAVEHESGRRFRVYWIPAAGRDGEPGGDGVCGARMTATWQRTTGGKLAVSYGQLDPAVWRSRPWEDRSPVVWSSAAAVDELDTALAAYEEASAARSAALGRAWQMRAAIARQWEAAAEEQARLKFIDTYEDPGLWPDHAKGLRFNCPYLTHSGSHWQKPWENAVERLTLAGADLSGLTVAGMAGLHATLFGEHPEVPEDIAGYRFPSPEGGRDEDSRAR